MLDMKLNFSKHNLKMLVLWLLTVGSKFVTVQNYATRYTVTSRLIFNSFIFYINGTRKV